MSQSAPGWYQDHDDPRLARWWDGERWTEHTLVLDEQDWSTEPAAPDGSTRFPVDTGSVTAVEGTPAAGWEDDIYAPIRDPWGDEVAAADPATTAWTDPDPNAWDQNTQAAPEPVVSTVATTWDEERWVSTGRRPGSLAATVQDWPPLAKVGVPILLVVILLFLFVNLSGGDDDPVTTNSSTTTEAPSLADAADAALRAAGNGPFTASTFTTLIPLTCDAADADDPSMLVDRINLLGYDTDTIGKLVAGLRAGTTEYCSDDMAKSPTLLSQVESSTLGGTTSSTSTVATIPGDTTSTTKKPTTATTKKPTTGTTKPTTPPTSPPTTPPTSPPTTPPTTPPSTDPPPTTPTTEANP